MLSQKDFPEVSKVSQTAEKKPYHCISTHHNLVYCPALEQINTVNLDVCSAQRNTGPEATAETFCWTKPKGNMGSCTWHRQINQSSPAMFWFRESLNGRMLQKNSFVLQHINGHPIGLTSNIHPLNESHETENHMKPKIPQWQQLQHCNIHSSRSRQNICNSVFGTLTQIFGKLDHVFDNQVPATIWRFWKRKTLPGDTPFHPMRNNFLRC